MLKVTRKYTKSYIRIEQHDWKSAAGHAPNVKMAVCGLARWCFIDYFDGLDSFRLMVGYDPKGLFQYK